MCLHDSKKVSQKYQKYKHTYLKNTWNVKYIPKTILKMPESIPIDTVPPYIYQPSSIYSITGWLKFWPQKFHSFAFYDRNKYKPLANDNPKQYLESWIYDPNKYRKMWKDNPYLRHIPVTNSLWHIPVTHSLRQSELPRPIKVWFTELAEEFRMSLRRSKGGGRSSGQPPTPIILKMACAPQYKCPLPPPQCQY